MVVRWTGADCWSSSRTLGRSTPWKQTWRESPFPQRITDLDVISAVKAARVKSYIIIMPPDVYSLGTGLFRTQPPPAQIPDLVHDAITQGTAAYIRDESGVVSHVHVEDYEVLVGRILEGAACAIGMGGIYFCAAGKHDWREGCQEDRGGWLA